MNKVCTWLATSPIASVLKIAVGAGLGALADQLATSGISPIWVAVGAAVIPVIVNAINPDDPRYGRTRDVAA